MIPEGLLWNEAEIPAGDALHSGLVSLLVIKDDLSPELVGTAFLIAADGNRATAITAAHCFDQIRRLLHPHSCHSSSALPEFLPDPKELDLRQVKAVYEVNDRVFPCSIEQACWDTATDLAIFTILAPKEAPDLFHTLLLDRQSSSSSCRSRRCNRLRGHAGQFAIFKLPKGHDATPIGITCWPS